MPQGLGNLSTVYIYQASNLFSSPILNNHFKDFHLLSLKIVNPSALPKTGDISASTSLKRPFDIDAHRSLWLLEYLSLVFSVLPKNRTSHSHDSHSDTILPKPRKISVLPTLNVEHPAFGEQKALNTIYRDWRC